MLIYIGLLLMPWKRLWTDRKTLGGISKPSSPLSLLVSLATYAIDKGLLLCFGAYTLVIIYEMLQHANLDAETQACPQKKPTAAYLLFITTGLLLASVLAQQFLFPPS